MSGRGRSLAWQRSRATSQRADDASVAKAVASSVARPGRKRSSAGAFADACLWAKPGAPTAGAIVSSARPSSVRSKQRRLLGHADSANAGRRRLLESQRSGSLALAGGQTANAAHERHSDPCCRNAERTEAGVRSGAARAAPCRLQRLCARRLRRYPGFRVAVGSELSFKRTAIERFRRIQPAEPGLSADPVGRCCQFSQFGSCTPRHAACLRVASRTAGRRTYDVERA